MSFDIESKHSDQNGVYQRLLELKALYLQQISSSPAKKLNNNSSTPVKKNDRSRALNSPRTPKSPTSVLKKSQSREQIRAVNDEEENYTPKRKRRKSMAQVLKKPKNNKSRKKDVASSANTSKPKFVKLKPINFDIYPDQGTACCQCGVTKTPTWYLGPELDKWRCKNCGEDWSRFNACPVCGLVYEEESHHDHNDEESADEETDSWIECDKCGRWVMTNCGGIKDLSLYDDNNPDHLPYECPFCVGKMESLPRVFYRKSNVKLFEAYVNEQIEAKKEIDLQEENEDITTRKLLNIEHEILGMKKTEKIESELETFREHLSQTWKSILESYHQQFDSQLELLRKEKNDFELKIEKEILSQYANYVKKKIGIIESDQNRKVSTIINT